MKQGGVRLIPWYTINPTMVNDTDYSNALKVFWVNGWDNKYSALTPTSSLADFWCVLHIPCQMETDSPGDDMSFTKQIWLGVSGNRLYTRSYIKSIGWTDFIEK